jgi:hypothetical protein
LSPISSPMSAAQRALDTEPQSIDAPMSAAAAFLVLVVKDDDASIATARSVVSSTDDLVKDVRIRADGGVFTCNVGISQRAWGRCLQTRSNAGCFIRLSRCSSVAMHPSQSRSSAARLRNTVPKSSSHPIDNRQLCQ